jgi:hypothetical protein
MGTTLETINRNCHRKKSLYKIMGKFNKKIENEMLNNPRGKKFLIAYLQATDIEKKEERFSKLNDLHNRRKRVKEMFDSIEIDKMFDWSAE